MLKLDLWIDVMARGRKPKSQIIEEPEKLEDRLKEIRQELINKTIFKDVGCKERRSD